MLKLRLDLGINYYAVPVTLPTQTYLLGEKTSQRCGGSQAGGGSGTIDRSLSRNIDQDPRVWALFFQYDNKTSFWPIRVSIKDF